ncbi:MAG: hypothetical protein KDB23_31215, partial [Planctomycetales bacterium]|nr:hypothetical protein [Planctomycetales bacterium]
MPPRRTDCELPTTAVNLLRVGLVLICLSCAPTTLIAETLTWIGAGMGELNSIDPSDPSTAWSEPSNWGDNPANDIPQLDTAGQGTTAQLTFTNGGRVYANELTAERVVIDNQYAAPSWEGQLVLGPDGPMQIGNELSLSGGATVVQQGGTLEMLAEDSAVQLTDGSQFRVENGSFHSTGSLSLSGASTFYVATSIATFDTISLGDGDSRICSGDNSTLQVRRLEFNAGLPFSSCLSGRLEVQEIATQKGQGGEITDVTTAATLAPTDFVNGRETAVLQIDGDAYVWGGVDWQLLGPEPGTGYDQVAATGMLTISGWLRVRTTPLQDLGPGVSIYLPRPGDTFDLATSAVGFQLTEIGVDFPRYAFGKQFDGAWNPPGMQGLRLITIKDIHIAAGDLDGDEQLDVDDVDHLARAIRTHNNIEFY